jgi:hypothetical protein
MWASVSAEPPRAVNRTLAALVLAVAGLGLSGCAVSLSESFQQSLSVIVPKKIDFAELDYYAQRANAAYDPIPQIRKDYPKVTRAVTVQSVDVRYFVETDTATRTQTLSIRGTAERPNVWEDIETALVPDTVLGIPLHRGFQKDAAAIYDDVFPHLRKDYPLRLTGHSLGGAVAVILAGYFEKQGFTVDRVVTFGQPKLSTRQPPETTSAVTTRVVHDLDVVPMIPPYTPARPYQHFAPEVILRQGPSYVYLNQHDADRLSAGDFWRNLTDFSAKEHHMDGYVANIDEKRENGAQQVPYLFEPATVSPMAVN